MNNLANLLKQLAELDPAICEVTEHTLFLPTAGYGCGLGLFDEETQDRLQGVIQRAIVERGWGYEIHSNRYVENGGPKVRCHIEKNTGLIYDNIFYDSPAMALLSAYILSLSKGM